MMIENTALIIKIREDSIKIQTAALDATIIIVQELDKRLVELLEKVDILQARIERLENS